MTHARRTTIPLALVLFAALAVLLSGCGASETSHTSSTASVNAGATAPSGQVSHVSTQSTTAKVLPTGGTPPPKVNPVPKRQTTSPPASAKAAPPTPAAKPKTEPTVIVKGKIPKAALRHVQGEEPVDPPYVFPPEVKRNFMAICTTAKDSAPSCECFIAKYQVRDVEEGHAIAEL